MVFSSPTFLYAFLPLFLIAYFAWRSMAWRNAVLLVSSLLFYAWGETWFVLLLLASICVNWWVALAIATADEGSRKRTLIGGIVLNLAVLGVAKYADFAVATVNGLYPSAGIPQPNLPLPLGISFFTFHAISYLFDVYRRNARAEESLMRVAIYISMFPQLVAGPIVRFRTVAKQLRQRRSTVWRAATGARIFAIGMAQKVLIANEVGVAADVAFALGPDLDAGEAWLGLASYTLQIYYDFAGYSNMAVGLGFVIGFGFPRNFDLPYMSRSVTEFWRRWHMSLSRWFRDYLYIPLGGNRHGPFRTYFNLTLVFLLCGLWHGASWNFVIWGAWHGGLLVAERAFLGGILDRTHFLLRRVYLMLAVMLGWVWFRAETFGEAAVYFRALLGLSGDGAVDSDFASVFTPYWLVVFAAGCLLALFRLPRLGRGKAAEAPVPALAGRAYGALAARLGADIGIWALLLLSLVGLAGATNNPFLYFRF
jgi:alginate O-acetyltransferase complex protein AlgI